MEHEPREPVVGKHAERFRVESRRREERLELGAAEGAGRGRPRMVFDALEQQTAVVVGPTGEVPHAEAILDRAGNLPAGHESLGDAAEECHPIVAPLPTADVLQDADDDDEVVGWLERDASQVADQDACAVEPGEAPGGDASPPRIRLDRVEDRAALGQEAAHGAAAGTDLEHPQVRSQIEGPEEVAAVASAVGRSRPGRRELGQLVAHVGSVARHLHGTRNVVLAAVLPGNLAVAQDQTAARVRSAGEPRGRRTRGDPHCFQTSYKAAALAARRHRVCAVPHISSRHLSKSAVQLRRRR